MQERDWDRLIDELNEGECTPFIGAGACSPTLPTAAMLCSEWADRYSYPFEEIADLPRVMEYAAIAEGDHVTVKKRLCRALTEKDSPDFTDHAEPHGLLAKLPLSVYLTTNYDDFMILALEREGKRPRPAICPWYERAPLSGVEDLVPRADEPIVYYLHGRCRHNKEDSASSIVVTESDYLEFLVNLALDRAADNKRVIPTPVLPSFTVRPLLFIGYSMRDLTFRVIFEGLRRAVPRVQRRQHVSVQLPLFKGDRAARDRATSYLTTYFGRLDISVYWGTAQDFCTELRGRLGWT